jgi:hypothetical protein
VFVSCCILYHRKKKSLLPFSKWVSFFFFFFPDDIVLWHDPLCMWVHSYALACVSCSVVRHIICIILWRIIINQRSIFASLWYRKERTQKERIGKRDIEVNIIDTERNERERERTIAAQYIRIYASQFCSVSLFLYSLLPSLNIHRKN